MAIGRVGVHGQLTAVWKGGRVRRRERKQIRDSLKKERKKDRDRQRETEIEVNLEKVSTGVPLSQLVTVTLV